MKRNKTKIAFPTSQVGKVDKVRKKQHAGAPPIQAQPALKVQGKYPVAVQKTEVFHHSETITAHYKCILHREDGPAVIDSEKQVEKWYKEGVVHRDGDEPAVKNKIGWFWYKNGKYHRENNPAVIMADGRQEWYINGELHRVGAPAIIDPVKGNEFWVNGVRQE